MKFRWIVPLVLAFIAAPAASQTVSLPTGCSTVAASNVAKSTDKVKLAADIACLDRAAPIATAQIAAARKVRADRLAVLTPAPVSTPTPPPSPAAKPITLFVGDSLSSWWAGNHTGIFAKAHPELDVWSEAVGGTGIAQVTGARLAADLARNPGKVTIFFGANDLAGGGYATEGDWWNAEKALGAKFEAIGAIVSYGTVLQQCGAVEHNRRATAINARIRAEKPFVDYAAQSGLADPCDKNVFADGVHPLDVTAGKVDGQALLEAADEAALTGMSMPMPPAPLAGYVKSPTLDGDPPFNVSFDINEGLAPAWGNGAIPGLYSTDEGAFRFVCNGDGQRSNDDPILYPGQPGKSHYHKYAGNLSADAYSTAASLAANAATNCNATPKSLNRSAYWTPEMENDQGQSIDPDYWVIYYKRFRSISPACTPGTNKTIGICIGIPTHIRFIFGWDPVNPNAPVEGASWYCTTGDQQHHDNLDDVFNSGCTADSDLVSDTVAPNCWNGDDLDTPDHRRHMAYPVQNGYGTAACPKTHPYLLPQEENKVFYRVTVDMIGTRPDGSKFSRIRLSSDKMMPGAKPGYTNHADYFENWASKAKAIWLSNCIEKGLSCNGGDLGNGQQLIGAAQPTYGWINPNPRAPLP